MGALMSIVMFAAFEMLGMANPKAHGTVIVATLLVWQPGLGGASADYLVPAVQTKSND